MQALHITETRAIVPVTRKLTQLRFTLEDLVGSAALGDEETASSKSSRGRLSTRRLGRLLPNAILQCQKASSQFIELMLSYDRTIRIPEFIHRERRYRTFTYSVSAEILWRPETGFCFVMDVPGNAIDAATWILSSAVLGYPGRLSSYELDGSRMRKVIGVITSASKGGPGELVRTVFRDVELNGSHFDEINIRAQELTKLGLFSEVQKGAGTIYAISFRTPLINEIGRTLSCRLDETGTVQIYSPRLSNESLRALLLWLEGALAK